MPKSIILIRWDDKLGTSLVGSYPERFKVSSRLLMNIYSAHRNQSTDPSFASLTLKDFKVSSFYSGMGSNYIGASNYIIALILRRDENPIKFKAILKKSNTKCIIVSIGSSKTEFIRIEKRRLRKDKQIDESEKIRGQFRRKVKEHLRRETDENIFVKFPDEDNDRAPAKSEKAGLKRMKKYAKKGKMKTIMVHTLDPSKIKHFTNIIKNGNGNKKSTKGSV